MSTNTDILLINPGGSQKKVYQDLSKVFTAIDTPFWAALTAGYLRKNNITVDLLDANAENMGFEETINFAKELSPKFIAIICYSQQANVCTPIMVAVGELCRMIKEKLPEVKLVLTGWHPSALPKQTLNEEACDYVAKGEGFKTLKDLVLGKPYKEIEGLWWRDNGIIASGPPASNISNLDKELSDVAWDLLPMDKYRAFSWMCLGDFSERTKFASLFTSLGCPYRCSFCAIHATYGEHKLRSWSPDWVIKQIDILVEKYGVKHINIHDEMYIFEKSHYRPIAEKIIERGYKLNINAFARVDVLSKINEEDLQLLKKAGFNWFKVGIETGNEEVRSNVSKNTYTIDDVRNAVDKTHRNGIDLCANFMFGLPGDDFDSMQDTLNLAVELLPAFPSFFCTMAIPGSDLYDESLAKGIKLPDTWLGYASQGYDFLPLPTEYLTAAEVLEFRDYAFTTYYDNPRFLSMIEDKFGKEAKEHLKSMNAIKLKRKLLGD